MAILVMIDSNYAMLKDPYVLRQAQRCSQSMGILRELESLRF